METFAERYTDQIRDVISSFDRVVISGSLPNIRHSGAMAAYLTAMGLKLFEYTTFVNKLRNELRENAQKIAEKAGLEIVFIRKLDDYRKEADSQRITTVCGQLLIRFAVSHLFFPYFPYTKRDRHFVKYSDCNIFMK